jgi:predicted small lipoprotein YifL
MTKPLATLILGLSFVAGPACGRKGPLELPRGRAPMAVERLSAVPKDGRVVLEWTNPAKTVSGRPLEPPGEVEIWVFERDMPAARTSLTTAMVEKLARLVRRVATEGSAASSFVFDPGPSGPKSLAFTVRVLDRKGRASDYSPVAVVEIVRPPAAVDRTTTTGVSL